MYIIKQIILYRAADNDKFESNKVPEKISKPHKVSPSKYESSPSSSVDSISDEEEEEEEEEEEDAERDDGGGGVVCECVLCFLLSVLPLRALF